MRKVDPEIFLIDQIINNMTFNLNWLQGKKTYIVATIGVVINGLYAMGYIPADYIMITNVVLGFLGLAALRAGVAK